MLELWEKLGEYILKLLTPCILIYSLLLTELYAHRKTHNSISVKHVSALLCHPRGVLTPRIKTS